MNKQETSGFVFGPLSFSVRNPRGLFCISASLQQRIAEMPLADAKLANKASWKMLRQCERAMNRYQNATRYPGLYDDYAGPHNVADAVRRATWQRIREAV